MAVGDATVVVTTHRVLVFTPGSGDRPRYRQIDRPNVGRIERTSSGRLDFLLRTALLAAVASFAAVVAVLVSFRDLVPDLEAGPNDDSGVDGAPGADAAGETLGLVETTFVLIDVAVLSTAVLAGLAACWYAARYVTSRDRLLVLEVYGDENVEIPIDTVGVAAIELQNAIDPGNALSRPSSAAQAGATDPDRSSDALDSDGEPPLETGNDPAVDAYGIRADTGSPDTPSSPDSLSTSSDHQTEDAVVADARADAGDRQRDDRSDRESGLEADASETGSVAFGAETDEPPEAASGVDDSFDDSPASGSDDPFDDRAGENDSVDPFDELDDSRDDPDPFDVAGREAASSDAFEWGTSASGSDPDWATDADREREGDDGLEGGTSAGIGSSSGGSAGTDLDSDDDGRDREVIDLGAASDDQAQDVRDAEKPTTDDEPVRDDPDDGTESDADRSQTGTGSEGVDAVGDGDAAEDGTGRDDDADGREGGEPDQLGTSGDDPAAR